MAGADRVPRGERRTFQWRNLDAVPSDAIRGEMLVEAEDAVVPPIRVDEQGQVNSERRLLDLRQQDSQEQAQRISSGSAVTTVSVWLNDPEPMSRESS